MPLKTKGQSSIEFLLALSIVFIIAIFIAGEFSNLTKTTIALAGAKESFYEKTADANKTIMVKKLEYIICESGMKINILTSPTSTGYTQEELTAIATVIQAETMQTSGVEITDITINNFSFPNTCNP